MGMIRSLITTVWNRPYGAHTVLVDAATRGTTLCLCMCAVCVCVCVVFTAACFRSPHRVICRFQGSGNDNHFQLLIPLDFCLSICLYFLKFINLFQKQDKHNVSAGKSVSQHCKRISWLHLHRANVSAFCFIEVSRLHLKLHQAL
jgi:hypothetical protein